MSDELDEQNLPLPAFPLAPLIGVRPPWHWANLDPDEREFLERSLDEFVADYNAHLALRPEHLIPACWRRHPYMGQVLPVLFFSWVTGHRLPDANVSAAMYFHIHDLPHFRDHLGDYLGPPAPSCRKGVHRDPGSGMDEGRTFIRTLETDQEVTGAPRADQLARVAFGAGVV